PPPRRGPAGRPPAPLGARARSAHLRGMSVDGRTPHGASRDLPSARDLPSVGDLPSARDLPSVGDLPSARDLPAAVVVGLMSGTSADGIDTVTVRLERRDGRILWEVLGRAAHAYPPDVAADLRRAMDPARSDVHLITQLHQRVGQAYADAVAASQAAHEVDLVGLSGQTVYHVPRVDESRGWRVKSTLQLGEAAVVAE